MIHIPTITHMRAPSSRRIRRHPFARLAIAIIHALLTVLMMSLGAALGYGILILLGGYGHP